MSTRPAPSASGTFSKTPLAHVLLHVRSNGLNGTLAVQAQGGELHGESMLAFERGALGQVRLSSVLDPLGFVLCELGLIQPAHLDASLAKIRGGGLQGEILVNMGACGPDAVQRGLAEQNRRKLRRFFDLPDASYQYYDGHDFLRTYGGQRVLIDMLATMWRGIRANPESPVIEGVLTRVGANALRLKQDHADLRRFGFGVEEEAVLDILRFGDSTIAGLLDSGQDSRIVRAVAYTLVITKVADIVPAGARPVGPSPRASAPAVSAAPPAPEPDPEPSAPEDDGRDQLAPPMRKKFDEAEARFEEMQEQTYYQMLEITDKATTNDVKSAFMAAAAKWHPDRVGSGAPLVLDAYKKVFALLNEAQNTLTDFDQRKKYDVAAKDGGGTPGSQKRMIALLEAATEVQKAEICLKRRDYAEAERLTRRALRAVPDDPTAMTVLAQVLTESKPDTSAAETEKLLVKALEFSPENDKALVMLGLIIKRKGNVAEALKMFKKAAELNPKNMDATREVRVAEMRERNRGGGEKEAPAATGVAGLASKLTSGLSSLSKLVKKS